MRGTIRSCQGRATFSLTFTQTEATGVRPGSTPGGITTEDRCYMRDNRWSYTQNTQSDAVFRPISKCLVLIWRYYLHVSWA